MAGPHDDPPDPPDDDDEEAIGPRGGGKSQALVRRPSTELVGTGGPAPSFELAPSLEKARPRSFVYIDRKGQVRSPQRYRALQAVSYGAAGVAIGAVTVIYGSLLGLPGILAGVGLGMWFGWQVRRAHRLHLAARYLVHDRLDEAEALLKQVLTSLWLPRRMRALAEQNLAGVFARRGDYEGALKHQRAAMAAYARAAQNSPLAQAVAYGEVMTLINLNRPGEARQRLEQRKTVPTGDYLKVLHWSAELYVCFAEREHRLSLDELHERSRVALSITGAAGLLGLCAWAATFSRDTDQAWHLLREAYDRAPGTGIERGLPVLWKWMEEHRKEAGAALPSDDLP